MKNKVITLILIFCLILACATQEKRAKKKLEQIGIEYSEKNFFHSIIEGKTEEVKLFLEAGISLGVKEEDKTALIEATRRGYDGIALMLIDAGADVNAKDDYGVTALMYAAIAGSFPALQKLLSKGADVNARDHDGRSALVEALTTENDLPFEAIKALIDAGADVNIRIYGGITPLMLVASGNPEILRLFINARADVNAKDDDGKTALRRAKNRAENVKILEEAGAKE